MSWDFPSNRREEIKAPKFWMVWAEDKNIPVKKHPSRENAVEEAKRISHYPNNIGNTIYVLEAIGYVETPVTTRWIDL